MVGGGGGGGSLVPKKGGGAVDFVPNEGGEYARWSAPELVDQKVMKWK